MPDVRPFDREELLVAITQGRIHDAGGLRIRVVSEDDDLCRIELAGELDGSNAEAVDAELTRAEQSAADRIVLDLNRLTFIDSMGLRLLVKAKRRADADSDRLRIRPGGDQVRRVMAITGIDAYMRFEDSDVPHPTDPS